MIRAKLSRQLWMLVTVAWGLKPLLVVSQVAPRPSRARGKPWVPPAKLDRKPP